MAVGNGFIGNKYVNVLSEAVGSPEELIGTPGGAIGNHVLYVGLEMSPTSSSPRHIYLNLSEVAGPLNTC